VLTRLRTRLAGDSGVTLVELLVGMTLSVIIGAMTLTLFVNASNATNANTDKAINVAQARNVLQSWTSYLAVADGPSYGTTSHRFEWLTANDVLFYADLGNRTATDAVGAPTVVWLRLTNQRLIEEQFAYGATTPKVCRILADRVTATPLFAAYDSTYAAMSSGSLGLPMATGGTGCTNLPASITQTDQTAVANLQKVSRVKVAFTITDTAGKHSTEFESSADVQG
jgi:type II secretory pathway pseudopilin PulG